MKSYFKCITLLLAFVLYSCEEEWIYYEQSSYSNGQFKLIKGYKGTEVNSYLNIEYYENGTLKKLTEIVDEEVSGLNAEYYDNGQLNILQEFEGGKLHGKAKGWYSDGSIMFEEDNFRGLKMSFQRYYPNGTKGSEIQYDYGRKTHGKFYHRNGQLRSEGDYRYDNRINNWVFYDSTGVLLQEIDYGDPVADRIKKAQEQQ